MSSTFPKRQRTASPEVELSIKHKDSLTIALTCIICSKYLHPPTRQCLNGHIVCSNCYNELFTRKMLMCGVCHQSKYFVKNIALDQVCESIVSSCNFEDCGFRTTCDKMGWHQKYCPKRPVVCTFGFGCDGKFSYKNLLRHLIDTHGMTDADRIFQYSNHCSVFSNGGPNKPVSAKLFKIQIEEKVFFFQELVFTKYIVWRVTGLVAELMDGYVSVLTLTGRQENQKVTYQMPIRCFRDERENQVSEGHCILMSAEVITGWCSTKLENEKVSLEWNLTLEFQKETFLDANDTSSSSSSVD